MTEPERIGYNIGILVAEKLPDKYMVSKDRFILAAKELECKMAGDGQLPSEYNCNRLLGTNVKATQYFKGMEDGIAEVWKRKSDAAKQKKPTV